MANKLVIYLLKERVCYITLNHPQNGNWVSRTMSRELVEICSQINHGSGVDLAVITGTGETFCSGGESKTLELSSGGKQNPLEPSVTEAIGAIECPTLAAINGNAIGEGLEIALSCDLRIASDTASFGLTQILEGCIPMNGGTQRLSRIVGKSKALEMVLTGEIIDAQEAFEIGLVNKVVQRDSLKNEIEEIGKTITCKAPFALRYAKEAVNKGLDLTLEQGMRLEADLYFLLHTTSDRTEGIQAYLQRRKPHFEGK